MERPRLLFLGHTLPIPEGGAGIRSYNLLRVLARTYDITVLSFYRRSTHPGMPNVARALESLREFAKIEVFPIAQEFSRIRFAVDHARSVAQKRAYTTFAYTSPAFAERLRTHIVSGDYALVHVDSLDLAEYLRNLDGIPVACTHQNLESRLLRRRAALERSALVRRYFAYQATLLEVQERTWCGRVSTNLVVSADDAAALKRIAPDARVIVAPNGVDTGVFEPRKSHERGLVFVGPASWGPNEDAMRFLGKDILPRLRGSQEDARVTWVGRATQAMREEFRRDFAIDMTGFADDVRPHIANAACFVVPLRMGGGTRLKILEAWAMGKAVVSTSVGCEGLAAEDGVNILIRDSAEAFADAVRAVLNDGDLRGRLGRAARDTTIRLYDWEVIGGAILNEYALLHAAPAEVSIV